MLRKKHLLLNLTVAALVLGLCSSALALQTKSRTSQGNNFGFDVNLGSTVFAGTHEYPRGSGNKIPTYEGGWGHFVSVVRDLDGNGSMEDTLYGSGRGRTVYGQRGSLEGMDKVLEGFNAGHRMDQWMGRVENNEVWSSLDPDCLTRWPVEFREGRIATGAPILHGVETMGMMHTDVWQRSYHRSVPPTGVSMEYRFHFLNFAESNDIAFGHLFIRNMSEYIQYNDNVDFRNLAAGTPNGQVWGEWALLYTENYIGIGADALNMDEGWAFHPEKEIKCMVDYNGMEAGFTRGGWAFILGYKSLRPCAWKGEEMALTNCNNMRWGPEFGFSVAEDIGVNSSPSLFHQWATAVRNGTERDLTPIFKGELSPWTGRPAVGVPGMLLPTDQRFSQWLWGRRGRINTTAWSALHDFGPRDTTSTDFSIMCCYPANPPMVLKPSSLEYIDDPELQTQMAPMEHMGDVVKIVYEGGYVLPETPTPPPLTIIPGDRQVTITWSNVNINTPDAYYYFIQQHPEVDPTGNYREYDFEGYKLYRSYVGPSDAHSEMIYECNLTDQNLQFYYIDTKDKDLSYSRMRNGLKVWYALVPYDRNWNPQTKEWFSLPAEGQSKVWNRPFPEGYHTVRPRSDASNFRAAAFGSASFTPGHGGALAEGTMVELRGDGTGKLLDAPQLLAPIANFELEAITSEKITQDQTVMLVCTGMESFDFGGCNWPTGTRGFELQTTGGARISAPPLVRGIHENGGATSSELLIPGPVDAAGAAYALKANFEGLTHGDAEANLYNEVDAGGYAGATVGPARYRCGAQLASAPNNMGWVTSAKFSLTWGAAANGELTIAVKNLTTGADVPFGQYPDDLGWGIAPGAIIGDRWGSGDNIYNELELPQSERTSKLLESLPADNAEDFGIYLNGIFWVFSDLTAMPAPGTVMTITTVWGAWNDDQTIFTQEADAPVIGDKWTVVIKAFSLNPEDIDLSKIKVVPNPYIASSMLDMGTGGRRIDFINLPDKCTIRIYSMGGNLVNVLNHIGASRTGWGNFVDVDALNPDNSPFEFTGYDNHSGTEAWNMKNRFGQTVASGLYFYHVTDARGKTQTGKFYIVN